MITYFSHDAMVLVIIVVCGVHSRFLEHVNSKNSRKCPMYLNGSLNQPVVINCQYIIFEGARRRSNIGHLQTAKLKL